MSQDHHKQDSHWNVVVSVVASVYGHGNLQNRCQLVQRRWQHTPVLLAREFCGQRSLVGCRLWGCMESDTTEWLYFHFSLSWIGEGNGNPLQCSCLENPRDRGAWWAAVYGVTQSRTWLKWLSSSSAKEILEALRGTASLTALRAQSMTLGGKMWTSMTMGQK